MGNYRILEPVGAGGMSVIYKAEQLALRRTVALKVPIGELLQDPKLAARFTTEMRAIVRLRHPNIVAAIDAGTAPNPDPHGSPIRYFVMEYVPRLDLEQFVVEHGPLPVEQACDLIHQVASALEKAHEHNLIHRDVKPSNIRVTADGQAKLVDFGLARLWQSRHTLPGSVLGTIDFMAPEQAKNAQAVDIRADIYALGGTMFWCLTGRMPFPVHGNLNEELARRMTQRPPSARALRPELPADLDVILARMMAVRPEERYDAPRHVMRALVPFIKSSVRPLRASPADVRLPADEPHVSPSKTCRVLIVDDQPEIRDFCHYALEADDIVSDQAETGPAAIEALRCGHYDLVMLDVDMPQMSGFEVLTHLRRAPMPPHLKIIMLSGRATANDLAEALNRGADDYLTKPFSGVQLEVRVRFALRLKAVQDRSEVLNQHLVTANRDFEIGLVARNSDLIAARNALAAALSSGLLLRSLQTPAHQFRMRRYGRRLAETARASAIGQLRLTAISWTRSSAAHRCAT